MSLLTMIVIPLVFIEGKIKKKILLYPIVVIGSSVISISVSFILGLLFEIPEYLVIKNRYLSTLCQSVPMLGMFLIAFVQGKNKEKTYEIQLTKEQYILFYIVIGTLFFLLAPIQSLSTGDMNVKNTNMIGFTTSIACIILIVVTMGYAIMVNRENQIKKQYQMQEQFAYLQRVYYKSLLGKDETMRRFRHDLKGHFIALQAYCEKGEYQELENYLATMTEHSLGKEKVCNTGNYAIDAIIMSFEAQARDQETTMKVKSCNLEKLKVTDFDFCTILYNLLQNALEATEQISDSTYRKIIISITRYQKMVYITVKNTIREEIQIHNNDMLSVKSDKRYHGLGGGNIKNILNKYNGSVNYACKSGWFIAKVII